MVAARHRGARYVLISPLRDDLPAELDAGWLPIKPGTDTALTVNAGTAKQMQTAFEKAHKARFGFIDRSKEIVVEAVSVEAIGGGAKGYACDVSSSESVDALFKAIEADFGTPHVLVNNAGITRDGLLMRMKDDDWDRVLDINLKGAFLCIRAVSRSMMWVRS